MQDDDVVGDVVGDVVDDVDVDDDDDDDDDDYDDYVDDDSDSDDYGYGDYVYYHCDDDGDTVPQHLTFVRELHFRRLLVVRTCFDSARSCHHSRCPDSQALLIVEDHGVLQKFLGSPAPLFRQSN